MSRNPVHGAHAHELAETLARVKTRTHAFAETLALIETLAHAEARALAETLAEANALAETLAEARGLAETLAEANALAETLAEANGRDDLEFLRNGARSLLATLIQAHGRAEALGNVDALGLESARAKAQRLVDAVDEALAGGGESGSAQVEGRRPSRVAVRVARYAVRVVPVKHRGRYDEEFQGELTEIAQERGGWGQLVYAVRVLGHGLLLRRALRELPPEAPEQARLR